VRRQIDLVDDQQVRADDPRTPLRGILSPAATSITYSVRSESSGLNVAARLSPPPLDDDHVEVGKFTHHPSIAQDSSTRPRGSRCADNRRSPPRDALGRQRLAADQEFSVLARIDIVGDHRDIEPVAQALAQQIHQRGLARADRSADTDT